MKISNYENFRQSHPNGRDLSDDQKAERSHLHQDFPHVVCVEAFYPEIDMAANWCWKNAGPEHGPCHDSGSEYPACELVLATEKIVVHPDVARPDGTTWKGYKEKTYTKPPEHGHIGNWKTFWYCKTGYDYGFMDFCFKNEADAEKFKAVAETLGLGERYEGDSEWG